MTPAELKTALDGVIENRRKNIAEHKRDLANAGKIAKQWDAIEAKRAELLDSVSWATRGELQR